MSGNKSIFYMIGYKIGYWYAENKYSLVRRAFGTVVGRLPGGRWITRLMR